MVNLLRKRELAVSLLYDMCTYCLGICSFPEAYNSTNGAISSQYRVQNMFCAGCLSSDWLRIESLSRIHSCSLRETVMI